MVPMQFLPSFLNIWTNQMWAPPVRTVGVKTVPNSWQAYPFSTTMNKVPGGQSPLTQTAPQQILEGNPDTSPYDYFYSTIDTTPRCRAHLLGQKCFKGEFCERTHSYPREDKILCKYYRENRCSRTASDCWFYHPRQPAIKPIPEKDRYLLVQPMGHLMRDLLSKRKWKAKLTKNINLPATIPPRVY